MSGVLRTALLIYIFDFSKSKNREVSGALRIDPKVRCSNISVPRVRTYPTRELFFPFFFLDTIILSLVDFIDESSLIVKQSCIEEGNILQQYILYV